MEKPPQYKSDTPDPVEMEKPPRYEGDSPDRVEMEKPPLHDRGSVRTEKKKPKVGTYQYKKKIYGSGQQWITVAVVVTGAILIISGLTMYVFINVFQEEPVEIRSVDFPFDKESLVSFTSLQDANSQIRSAVHREESMDAMLEIIFQQHGRTLFINDMLSGTNAVLPERVRDKINGFSVGVRDGYVFVLISFRDDAFPLMSNYSQDMFNTLEFFIGRASTRELERIKMANTLVVLRNGDVVYGFLNDNTIAVTGTKELFLDLLDHYRTSFN